MWYFIQNNIKSADYLTLIDAFIGIRVVFKINKRLYDYIINFAKNEKGTKQNCYVDLL